MRLPFFFFKLLGAQYKSLSFAPPLPSFSLPLPPLLISVGYCLVGINGSPVTNKCLEDGRSALEVVNDPKNYPLSLKFTRVRVSINERIMLLSMFHS